MRGASPASRACGMPRRSAPGSSAVVSVASCVWRRYSPPSPWRRCGRSARRPVRRTQLHPSSPEGRDPPSFGAIHGAAPACLALYQALALRDWLSAIVGEALEATADLDQSSCSFLYCEGRRGITSAGAKTTASSGVTTSGLRTPSRTSRPSVAWWRPTVRARVVESRELEASIRCAGLGPWATLGLKRHRRPYRQRARVFLGDLGPHGWPATIAWRSGSCRAVPERTAEGADRRLASASSEASRETP